MKIRDSLKRKRLYILLAAFMLIGFFLTSCTQSCELQMVDSYDDDFTVRNIQLPKKIPERGVSAAKAVPNATTSCSDPAANPPTVNSPFCSDYVRTWSGANNGALQVTLNDDGTLIPARSYTQEMIKAGVDKAVKWAYNTQGYGAIELLDAADKPVSYYFYMKTQNYSGSETYHELHYVFNINNGDMNAPAGTNVDYLDFLVVETH